MRKCEVCGYEKDVHKFKNKKLLCWKHYYQMRRHGRILKRTKYDPNEFIVCKDQVKIALYTHNGKRRGYALIDKSQLSRVKEHKWHIADRSSTKSIRYAEAIVNGKHILLHHFILGKKRGVEVDHKDGNGLNNKRENLRFVNHLENILNRTRKRSRSGIVGVYWRPDRTLWYATIRTKGQCIYLGSSKNLQAVIAKRKKAECKYWKICK